MPGNLSKQLARWFVLASTVLLLGGCVYLRLLELKHQLARFDENFVIQVSDDLTLRCLHPTLTGADLRWLGAEPRKIQPWTDGIEWSVRWVKVPPAGVTEESEYQMEFLARFRNDRLTEISIPQRYFAFFPKNLFLDLLRSTGSAQVNRDTKQAESRTETPSEIPLPNLKAVAGMLGAPTQQITTSEKIAYFYSYRLDLPSPVAPPIEVTFVFDPASGVLRSLTARLPRGALKYEFSQVVSRSDH